MEFSAALLNAKGKRHEALSAAYSQEIIGRAIEAHLKSRSSSSATSKDARVDQLVADISASRFALCIEAAKVFGIPALFLGGALAGYGSWIWAPIALTILLWEERKTIQVMRYMHSIRWMEYCWFHLGVPSPFADRKLHGNG